MTSTQIPPWLISQTLWQTTIGCTPCRSCMTTRTLLQTLAAICVHDGLPQYLFMSHSWTDSVWSHSIGWTYGSSPLAAQTRLHTSSVGLWSLSSSDLVTSTGHPTYILVPTRHDHLTLQSDMHNTLRIASPEPAPIVRAEMQPTLPKCLAPVREDLWHMVSKTDPP